MIYSAKINGGALSINNLDLSKFKEGDVLEVEIKKPLTNITKLQNRAMHLWFTQLAEALNKDGFDMRAVISPSVDIYWSAYTVKEHLWRPTMLAYLGKESTKDLETKQITEIYDIINLAISQRCGISVPFPSIENFREYK